MTFSTNFFLRPGVGVNVTNKRRMDTSSCMGPVINGKLQEFVLKAMMWTGSTQKTMDWVSEGTAVESEQGWF